jgi:bleomycin hydrolase
MHIVGTSQDQNGTKYYIIKNSWGEVSDYKGYLYMSAAYFRLKTVGVLVHKEAVPKVMWAKLEIE